MHNLSINTYKPSNSVEERLFIILDGFANRPITDKLVKQIKHDIKQEVFNMVQEGIVPEKELENEYYILQHKYDRSKVMIADKTTNREFFKSRI